MARTGRRPGNADTRGEVLAAARAVFADDGYHGATIRGIASAAEVDPSLVHHYFGTKEDLFLAAVQLPVTPVMVADAVLAGGMDGAGRRMVTLFLSVWEDRSSRDTLTALLQGAFATDAGATMLREFFSSAVVDRVAPHLEGPDVHLRVNLAISHLLGIALMRWVVGFAAIRDASVEELVDMVAPQVQAYLTP